MANRYALIYLPGLPIRNRNQSIDIISRRMANALNFLHSKTKYSLEEFKDEAYGAEDQITTVRTIRSKGKSAKDAWQLDLYELNYHSLLESAAGSGKKMSQFRTVLVALWFAMTRVFGLAFKKGKSTMEKLRMISGGAILVMLAVYLFMIIPTFIGTLHEYLHDYMGLLETDFLSKVLHRLDDMAKPLRALYIGTLTFGLFSNRKVQDQLRRYTLELAQVIRYFNRRGDGGSPTRQLVDLLRHVQSKEDSYKRIDILAYSFGNIIAMDTLFTAGYQPSEWVQAVDNMVGIGNPYDVVRTFWPRYFLDRQSQPMAPKRWINIYSPRDLLSSNFRNDRKEIAPENALVPGAVPKKGKGVAVPENIIFPFGDSLQDTPIWQIPFKVRVDTHSQYWSGNSRDGNPCFIRVAELLYG